MSKGCKVSFQNASLRKHKASQGVSEGRCITPAASSSALCPVSGGIQCSNSRYSDTGKSNQARSQAQAPACCCPCCLVIRLLPPQAALAQAMPGHIAGTMRTKDFSQQAAAWGMKGVELHGHNPGHGVTLISRCQPRMRAQCARHC